MFVIHIIRCYLAALNRASDSDKNCAKVANRLKSQLFISAIFELKLTDIAYPKGMTVKQGQQTTNLVWIKPS